MIQGLHAAVEKSSSSAEVSLKEAAQAQAAASAARDASISAADRSQRAEMAAASAQGNVESVVLAADKALSAAASTASRVDTALADAAAARTLAQKASKEAEEANRHALQGREREKQLRRQLQELQERLEGHSRALEKHAVPVSRLALGTSERESKSQWDDEGMKGLRDQLKSFEDKVFRLESLWNGKGHEPQDLSVAIDSAAAEASRRVGKALAQQHSSLNTAIVRTIEGVLAERHIASISDSQFSRAVESCMERPLARHEAALQQAVLDAATARQELQRSLEGEFEALQDTVMEELRKATGRVGQVEEVSDLPSLVPFQCMKAENFRRLPCAGFTDTGIPVWHAVCHLRSCASP